MSKKSKETVRVKIPIISEHQSPDLIRETGEDGSVVYKHPNSGTEWDVYQDLSFHDFSVTQIGNLRNLVQHFDEDLYYSGLGIVLDQMLEFILKRMEEVDYLLEEHFGEIKFHQIDRSEYYANHFIIGMTVKPKTAEQDAA